MLMNKDVATDLAGRNANELTNEELTELMEIKPVVMAFLKDIEAEAKRRLDSGNPGPGCGLKLVEGASTRNWAQPVEDIAKKLKQMGVPKDVMFKQELVSPAQAESLTWTNRAGEIKRLSERQIQTLNKNFIKKKQPNLIVALESDERAAVNTDASGMFGSVNQEQSGSEAPTLPAWLT